MLPYGTEFMMVTLVDDGPVRAPENGATQDRICFMSGSDPIFPRLVISLYSTRHVARICPREGGGAEV